MNLTKINCAEIIYFREKAKLAIVIGKEVNLFRLNIARIDETIEKRENKYEKM